MREVPVGKKGLVALVDDEDYDMVSKYKWHPNRKGYAVANIKRNGRWTGQTMHNMIMGCVGVDHVDRKRLNNQRSNLRAATSTQNSQNRSPYKGTTSQYKGVSWRRNRRRWIAYIRVNRKLIGLGTFRSEEDAAHAYDAAAVEYFGEFACINFSEETVNV